MKNLAVRFLTLVVIGFSLVAAPVVGHASSVQKKVYSLQNGKIFYGKAKQVIN